LGISTPAQCATVDAIAVLPTMKFHANPQRDRGKAFNGIIATVPA
jgi:hypothetical protein